MFNIFDATYHSVIFSNLWNERLLPRRDCLTIIGPAPTTAAGTEQACSKYSMNERTNEWTNEWMNKRTNDHANEWTSVALTALKGHVLTVNLACEKLVSPAAKYPSTESQTLNSYIICLGGFTSQVLHKQGTLRLQHLPEGLFWGIFRPLLVGCQDQLNLFIKRFLCSWKQ